MLIIIIHVHMNASICMYSDTCKYICMHTCTCIQYMYMNGVHVHAHAYMYIVYRPTTVLSGFVCLTSPLKKYTEVAVPSGLMTLRVPLGKRITLLPSSSLDSV